MVSKADCILPTGGRVFAFEDQHRGIEEMAPLPMLMRSCRMVFLVLLDEFFVRASRQIG